MKWRCVFSFLLLILLSVSATSELEWEIQIVDDTGEVSPALTSLAIDSKGFPHIGYIRFSSETPFKKAMYAYWAMNEWQILELFLLTLYIPVQVSLALESNDNPHIVYGSYDLGGWTDYIFWDGFQWQSHSVSLGGSHCSIALDNLNHPHVVYCFWTDIGTVQLNPKYVYHDGQSWECLNGFQCNIDTLPDFDGIVSIDIDKKNNVHVAYNLRPGGLRYAVKESTDWKREIVDSEVDCHRLICGYFVSLAIDSCGHPHMSYNDPSKKDLKFARKRDSTWDIVVVDSLGNVGSSNSLALDQNGFYHIGYYDASSKDLKCAHWNGTSWEIEKVDTLGEVGDFNAIAIDDEGCLHISYYDATNRFLKYAKSTSVYMCSGDKGDVDNDGSVDVIDVIRTIRYVFDLELFDLCSRERADCNADGLIDMSDVIGIVNVILCMGTCPPVRR